MKKIIIVEDDEAIREELANFLSKYGYDIKVPWEFENILEYIANEKGDLILLDINLPVDDSTLSVNITRLRKKLEEIGVGNSIETRRGLGYVMP